MEEEKRDVFSVSVGNIPPRTSVLIKIVYVAELSTVGGDVVFRVPANVAPSPVVGTAEHRVLQVRRCVMIGACGDVSLYFF